MSFQIIRNDITKVKADAIVNSANPKPVYATGTDGAIYAAAGADELLAERKKIGCIGVGQAAYTPAFALKAKYIIHTAGPVWEDGGQDELQLLRQCYENSLKLAKELGCESVAFPLISTGVYGFPKDEALKVAVAVFSEFLLKEDMEIILVVFDRESFVVSGKVFSGVDEYIDENYVEETLHEEYRASARASMMYSGAAPARSLPKPGMGNFLEGVRLGRLAKASRDSEAMREPTVKEPAYMDRAFSVDDEVSEECTESLPETTRSLDDVIGQLGETWQECLLRLIDEKGYTDTEVYKRANVDRKLFSKIRCNSSYQPKKITSVAFALALRLNLDETRDFLSKAGYAFSNSSKFDLIVEYFIENEVYDTYTINLALFEHEQPTLGV